PWMPTAWPCDRRTMLSVCLPRSTPLVSLFKSRCMPIPKVPLRSPSPRWIRPALNAAGRQLGAFGVALLGALAPSVAHAHGAFPQSAFVYEDPSDDQRIWVGASFGLLTSTDRGASWYWLCENAPGYEGVKPKMDVSANGSLLVGSFDGVN